LIFIKSRTWCPKFEIMTTLNITTGSITIDNQFGGGINGMAYFTASATWSIPDGVTKVRVVAIGAGGGGCAGSLGGGGGGYAEDVVSVAGFSTLPVTVGTGGAAGAGGGAGSEGGSSGFLNITASGGRGQLTNNTDGKGGSGSNAMIITIGQRGDDQGGGSAANLPSVSYIPTNAQAAGSQNFIGHGGYGNSGVSPGGISGSVTLYY
jgi:hypothetical protein